MDGAATAASLALGESALARSRRRVTMADVDAAGILYFAAPYPWLEEAFTGWLKGSGHPLGDVLGSGLGCPCVTSATAYHAPLVLDDELTVSLHPSSVGRSSFSLTIEVVRESDRLLAVRTTGWHVWSEFDRYAVPPSIRPTALPEWLDSGLRAVPLVTPVRTITTI